MDLEGFSLQILKAIGEQLEMLDLSGSIMSTITDEGLKHVTKYCPNLENLGECASMNGRVELNVQWRWIWSVPEGTSLLVFAGPKNEMTNSTRWTECFAGISALNGVTGITLIPLFERSPENNNLRELHLSCKNVRHTAFVSTICCSFFVFSEDLTHTNFSNLIWNFIILNCNCYLSWTLMFCTQWRRIASILLYWILLVWKQWMTLCVK